MPRPVTSEVAEKSLLRHTGGAAGVEFALLLPTLIVLLIGALDVGTLVFEQMQVNAAAHAGALYALRYGWNLAGVQAAVTGSTGLTVTASPAPQTVKGCIVSGVFTVQSNTTTTCTGGGTPGSYVQVNAQAAVSPLIVWSAIVMPTTLTAQAVIRIQ